MNNVISAVNRYFSKLLYRLNITCIKRRACTINLMHYASPFVIALLNRSDVFITGYIYRVSFIYQFFNQILKECHCKTDGCYIKNLHTNPCAGVPMYTPLFSIFFVTVLPAPITVSEQILTLFITVLPAPTQVFSPTDTVPQRTAPGEICV